MDRWERADRDPLDLVQWMIQPALAAAAAVFLSSTEPQVLDEAAHALGVVPDWLPFAVITNSLQVLEPQLKQALDNKDIITSSGTTLDRIAGAIVVAGAIAAHHQVNLRVVTDMRKKARGNLDVRPANL